jgi:ElaB/YqjD/DUF883 family membrane-anchored ribosome-binding protein
MTGDDNDLAVAKLRAEVARARLAGTLVDIQARLKPKALVREAMQEMKEAAQEVARDGLDSLKRHPLTLAGATAALGLLFARGPLRHVIDAYMDETPEAPASLTPKRARARRKGPSE